MIETLASRAVLVAAVAAAFAAGPADAQPRALGRDEPDGAEIELRRGEVADGGHVGIRGNK